MLVASSFFAVVEVRPSSKSLSGGVAMMFLEMCACCQVLVVVAMLKRSRSLFFLLVKGAFVAVGEPVVSEGRLHHQQKAAKIVRIAATFLCLVERNGFAWVTTILSTTAM